MRKKKEENMRDYLTGFKSPDDFYDVFNRAKNIIVISGAGISVSCGIPDFRSKDIGLYDSLRCDDMGIPSAELLFDYEYFLLDPAPFYKYLCSFWHHNGVDSVQPSRTHNFIKWLESENKLLRNYTQNIDGLEKKASIERVVQCHGHYNSFSCIKCSARYDLEDDLVRTVLDGNVPHCAKCKFRHILKPDITFFGERISTSCEKQWKLDIRKCDLLIVIGTSLQVNGSVVSIIKGLSHAIPQVFINQVALKRSKKVVPEGYIDLTLVGHCDTIANMIYSQYCILNPSPNVVTGSSQESEAILSSSSVNENSSTPCATSACVESDVLLSDISSTSSKTTVSGRRSSTKKMNSAPGPIRISKRIESKKRARLEVEEDILDVPEQQSSAVADTGKVLSVESSEAFQCCKVSDRLFSITTS